MRKIFVISRGIGLSLLVAATLAACQLQPRSQNAADLDGHAPSSITAGGLLRHVQVLASDRFEGRAPGTHGEELTVDYLMNEFKRMGLVPGNPDGSYLQRVPLSGFISHPEISYGISNVVTKLQSPDDCVLWSRRAVPEITVKNSPLVFVGYGVVAPEYGWDDYKDVDVRGKTIVMLINDPPVPDPSDPARLDQKMFKGRAMTYYGRWTYKYEIATAKGAAAAVIVHETGPAGYPYAVVVGSNSRENFDLQRDDQNRGRVAVEGWMALEQGRRLFAACGQSFEALKASAARRDFVPVVLGATASIDIHNELRTVVSQNVVGAVRGSDPALRNEWVIYSAHWDHLGRDGKLAGDQIYNGALDNASGTAALLELAGAFARLRPAPRRSVLFLSVTAEEKGLLGAQYYAAHPLYPLPNTVANINMDSINPWGRTRDVEIIGRGNTTLEDVLSDVASSQGRIPADDSSPESGRFFRSDHFEFAKKGVPALYLHPGIDFLGKPAGFGARKSAEYTSHDYHKVTDEIKPDWDFAGGAEDAQLLFEVGRRVADSVERPRWKKDANFRPNGFGVAR